MSRTDRAYDQVAHDIAVLSSGVAGGVAGCVVSQVSSVRYYGPDLMPLGEDGYCAFGPCQDPIPNFECRVPEICW